MPAEGHSTLVYGIERRVELMSRTLVVVELAWGVAIEELVEFHDVCVGRGAEEFIACAVKAENEAFGFPLALGGRRTGIVHFSREVRDQRVGMQ